MDLVLVEYIILLIKEIFTEGLIENTITPSTALLIRAGLPRDLATKLSIETFKTVVDIISVYVPNATFSPEEAYRYEVCNDADLIIHDPYLNITDF